MKGSHQMTSEEATIHWLRSVSHVLLWVTVIFQILTVTAASGRYYVERREKRLSSKLSADRLRRTQETAEASQRELASLKEELAPRHLTDEQKSRLLQTLSNYKDEQIEIRCIFGDHESKEYGEEFVSIFRSAGWNTGGSLYQTGFAKDPHGVQIAVNANEAAGGRLPSATMVLRQELLNLGIMTNMQILAVPDAEVGKLNLYIGKK
jgi:hypothetical protein